MSKRTNPLEEWRASRSPATVAFLLGMTQRSYLILESQPRKSRIRSNKIIKISQITGIPLESLIDYLTETHTIKKESVTC